MNEIPFFKSFSNPKAMYSLQNSEQMFGQKCLFGLFPLLVGTVQIVRTSLFFRRIFGANVQVSMQPNTEI